MLKKIILSTVLASFIFTSLLFPFAKGAKAAEYDFEQTWYYQYFWDWSRKVYDDTNTDEIFGERYTAAQVQWILYSFFGISLSFAIGPKAFGCVARETANGSVSDAFQTCWQDIEDWFNSTSSMVNVPHDAALAAASPETQKEPTFKETVANYITNNNLSGVGYVAKSIQKINPHLIPEAKAQGFGYTIFPSGNVFRQLWATSRDIAYFIVVLAVIYISFLVMFRSKVSAQAVVSVQSSLPKIIITLVLITFSYAIAGFMIDIMYVLIGLVATIVNASGVATANWSTLFNFLTIGPYGLGIIGYFFYYAKVFFITSFSSALQVMASPNLPAFITGYLSLWLLPVILLIMVIIFIIAMFKTLFTIIKAYVNIVLSIIGAPIILAAGLAFPGIGFGSWFNSMLGNILIFPVISVLSMLALIFALAGGGLLGTLATNILDLMNAIQNIFTGTPQWMPNWNTSYFSNIDNVGWAPPMSVGMISDENHFLPFLLIIASAATLLLIPKAADLVKSMISRKPFATGSAIGEALGPLAAGYALGRGAAGGAATAAWNTWAPKNFQSWANMTEAIRRNTGAGAKIPGQSNPPVGRDSGGKH